MSIVLDTTNSYSPGNVATMTMAYTVGANANFLWLTFFFNAGFNNPNLNSVTYAGTNMVPVLNTPAQITSQFEKLYCYYLLNPAKGANNIVITWSGLPGTASTEVGAISLAGVDPVFPFDNQVNVYTNVPASVALTNAIATASAGAWVLDQVMGTGNNGTPTMSSPQVVYMQLPAVNCVVNATYQGPVASPGIVTDTCTNPGGIAVGSGWAEVLAAIRPATMFGDDSPTYSLVQSQDSVITVW